MATSKRQAEGGSQVGLITAWTADAEAGGNADQFVLLEALEGPDGNRYVENASNYLDISDRELVISKDCENPEKLLAWADDFYDNVVTLQTTYGSIFRRLRDRQRRRNLRGKQSGRRQFSGYLRMVQFSERLRTQVHDR